ncbi:MAG: hypothetical protein ACREAZ_00185 [Nitrososphaera sp.]
MSSKIFCFDASSFTLEPSIESFLRSNDALRMDFGNAAYVDSEKMPQILAGLMSESSSRVSSNENLLMELRAELSLLHAECEKLVGVNANLSSRVDSQSTEIASLKEQLSSALKKAENLEAEDARLQLALKSSSQAASNTVHTNDESLKQLNDKLRKELDQVRGESIEAIASMKVLEAENEELRQELDQLRGQLKPATAPKIA